MLQYLNQIAFAPFGKILKSNFEGTPHTIQKRTQMFFSIIQRIFSQYRGGRMRLKFDRAGEGLLLFAR